MKKLIGAAIAAGATIAGAGVANAEISGNVQVTSDYVFRGISLNDSDPAVQGGLDWSNDQFYVGTWASPVVEGIELDLYAGWTPSTGPVSWDIGVVAYTYPGAHDTAEARFNYYEVKVGAAMDVMENLNLGAAYYYSPDNYGGTGEATYWEVNGDFTICENLHLTAAFGNQEIEDADGPGLAVTNSDSYNTWNVGATYTWNNLELDVRYTDTDIDAGSDIEFYTYGPESYDANVVVTLKANL